MQIKVYTIGKTKDSALAELIASYHSKLKFSKNPHFLSLLIADRHPQQAYSPAQILAEYKFSVHNSFFLAEWGRTLSTESWQKLLQTKLLEAEDVNLIIGNAFGWHKEAEINYISLSALTFTHELATLMLWEQLYRFSDLLLGGKFAK